ncbi:Zinc finger homeobox protein 3, partial [Cichlidogyrus casuarinus]
PRKRKLTQESSDEDELSQKNLKAADMPLHTDFGSDVKCPCCMKFVPARQFPLHECFRQLASQFTTPEPERAKMEEASMGDLNMLFTLFKGTSQFRDRLLQVVQRNFERCGRQTVVNYAALSLELFAQRPQRGPMPTDPGAFRFDDLASWQSLTPNNECSLCNPKRCFLLPSNKSLHVQLHHELIRVDATIPILVQCVEQTLSYEVPAESYNTPLQFLNRLKALIPEKQVVEGSSFNFDIQAALSVFSNVILKAQNPMKQDQPVINSMAQEMLLAGGKKTIHQEQTTRRGRTRLTSTQLSILRSYFDINNSPTEDKLVEICSKTGLQEKVVKHWFRNTLFKERQKNKDNPYNFSVPPSTSIDLEMYEKTGKIQVKQAEPMETTESKVPKSNFSLSSFLETKQEEKSADSSRKGYSDEDSNASVESSRSRVEAKPLKVEPVETKS